MKHYEALELPNTASAAEIRSAYRYLDINAAYEVLSDSARRTAYDWQLRIPLPSPILNHTSGRARDARHRSAAQHPSSSAPKRRTSYYQDVYVRYADIGRLACRVLLIFSLLIGLDRLWVLDFPHEQVLRSDFYDPRKGASYCVVETPHASVRGQCFYTGQILAMKRTALFRQVLSCHIVSAESNEEPIEYKMHENIYVGAGLLLPLALLLTATVGAWPGRVGRRQVDCATMAVLLAVITVWLIIQS